jgi:hypothetical protein
MSNRKEGGHSSRPTSSLCAIDQAVLKVHAAGGGWTHVPGMRSEARYRRTLARALRRQKLLDPLLATAASAGKVMQGFS